MALSESETTRLGVGLGVGIPLALLLLYLLIEGLIYLLARQRFQAWVLQFPGSLVAKILLPPIEVVESLYVGRTDAFLELREKHGTNFCAAGMVWLSSFKEVSHAVTNPQARTNQLGEHPLLPQNLPDAKRSRCVFLLSLSDQAAGGEGQHEGFRKCFVDRMLDNADVEMRRTDSTAGTLLQTLAQEYADLPHAHLSDPFFSDSGRGLVPFISKYLHYVMLGIDPSDKSAAKTLGEFFTGQGPIAHYFWPHGYFVRQTKLIDRVCEIYMASPAFQKFDEGNPAYFHMTKRELAALCASIMRIAGVQGFYQVSKIALGAFKMPKYNKSVPRFDQRSAWDALDLTDEGELQQYILECTRLDAPVSVTHRVATEPFSLEIAGRKYKYPKGTKIAIPLGLGNTDKDFWGDDAYKFDVKRTKLMDNVLSFQSKGGEHAGRECPAKDLVMKTLVTMLQRLGEVRRRPNVSAKK